MAWRQESFFFFYDKAFDFLKKNQQKNPQDIDGRLCIEYGGSFH